MANKVISCIYGLRGEMLGSFLDSLQHKYVNKHTYVYNKHTRIHSTHTNKHIHSNILTNHTQTYTPKQIHMSTKKHTHANITHSHTQTKTQSTKHKRTLIHTSTNSLTKLYKHTHKHTNKNVY